MATSLLLLLLSFSLLVGVEHTEGAHLTLCPTPAQRRALDAHHHNHRGLLLLPPLSHANALARFGPSPHTRSLARAFLDSHPDVTSVDDHGHYRFKVALRNDTREGVEALVREAPRGMFCPRIEPGTVHPTPRHNGVRRGADGLQPTGQNGPGNSPTYAVPSNLGYSSIYNTPNPETYVRLNFERNLNLVVLELDAPYLDSDLISFAELTGTLEGYGATTIVNLSQTGSTSGEGFDEASLDMQVAVSIAPSGVTNVIYFGCNNEGGYWEMECFLDVLDAWMPDAPFDIISFSWGEYELLDYEPQIFGYYYAGMLAALGVTMFFSSGDNGAPGDRNPNCGLDHDPPFSVQFPSSSPYATAVGATAFVSPVESDVQYYQSSSPLCNQGANIGSLGTSYGFTRGGYSSSAFFACVSSVSSETAVAAAQEGFSTGGGFSTWWLTPSWQQSAVDAYADLQSSLPFPNPSFYNTSMRGVPDISVFGCGTPVILDGTLYSLGGTSQSAPTAAALWVYIADFMLHQFNLTVGNINPLLYFMATHPMANMFNDVVTGNNNGTETTPSCSLGGFPAATGWDAASGLGSFNVGRMKVWMTLNPDLVLETLGLSTGADGGGFSAPSTGGSSGLGEGLSDASSSSSSVLDTLFTTPNLYYSVIAIVLVALGLISGVASLCLQPRQQQVQKKMATTTKGFQRLPLSPRRRHRSRGRASA
jgi:hypothetical protein